MGYEETYTTISEQEQELAESKEKVSTAKKDIADYEQQLAESKENIQKSFSNIDLSKKELRKKRFSLSPKEQLYLSRQVKELKQTKKEYEQKLPKIKSEKEKVEKTKVEIKEAEEEIAQAETSLKDYKTKIKEYETEGYDLSIAESGELQFSKQVPVTTMQKVKVEEKVPVIPEVSQRVTWITSSGETKSFLTKNVNIESNVRQIQERGGRVLKIESLAAPSSRHYKYTYRYEYKPVTTYETKSKTVSAPSVLQLKLSQLLPKEVLEPEYQVFREKYIESMPTLWKPQETKILESYKAGQEGLKKADSIMDIESVLKYQEAVATIESGKLSKIEPTAFYDVGGKLVPGSKVIEEKTLEIDKALDQIKESQEGLKEFRQQYREAKEVEPALFINVSKGKVSTELDIQRWREQRYNKKTKVDDFPSLVKSIVAPPSVMKKTGEFWYGFANLELIQFEWGSESPYSSREEIIATKEYQTYKLLSGKQEVFGIKNKPLSIAAGFVQVPVISNVVLPYLGGKVLKPVFSGYGVVGSKLASTPGTGLKAMATRTIGRSVYYSPYVFGGVTSGMIAGDVIITAKAEQTGELPRGSTQLKVGTIGTQLVAFSAGYASGFEYTGKTARTIKTKLGSIKTSNTFKNYTSGIKRIPYVEKFTGEISHFKKIGEFKSYISKGDVSTQFAVRRYTPEFVKTYFSKSSPKSVQSMISSKQFTKSRLQFTKDIKYYGQELYPTAVRSGLAKDVGLFSATENLSYKNYNIADWKLPEDTTFMPSKKDVETTTFLTEKGIKFITKAKDQSSITIGTMKPLTTGTQSVQIGVGKEGGKIFDAKTSLTGEMRYYVSGETTFKYYEGKSLVPSIGKERFYGIIQTKEIPLSRNLSSDITATYSRGSFFSSTKPMQKGLVEYTGKPFSFGGRLFNETYSIESISYSKTIDSSIGTPTKTGFKQTEIPELTYSKSYGKVNNINLIEETGITIKISSKIQDIDLFAGEIGQAKTPERPFLPGSSFPGRSIGKIQYPSISSVLKYPGMGQGVFNIRNVQAQALMYEEAPVSEYWKDVAPRSDKITTNIQLSNVAQKEINVIKSDLGIKSITKLGVLQEGKTLQKQDLKLDTKLAQRSTTRTTTIQETGVMQKNVLMQKLGVKQALKQKQITIQKLALADIFRSSPELVLKQEIKIKVPESKIEPPSVPPVLPEKSKGKLVIKPKKTKKKIRYKKPKKKVTIVKDVLAEPFRVQRSQIKFGKATHLKATPELLKLAKETGWKVPTLELIEEKKKGKKSKKKKKEFKLGKKIDFNWKLGK